jgi:hypothetical protein
MKKARIFIGLVIVNYFLKLNNLNIVKNTIKINM